MTTLGVIVQTAGNPDQFRAQHDAWRDLCTTSIILMCSWCLTRGKYSFPPTLPSPPPSLHPPLYFTSTHIARPSYRRIQCFYFYLSISPLIPLISNIFLIHQTIRYASTYVYMRHYCTASNLRTQKQFHSHTLIFLLDELINYFNQIPSFPYNHCMYAPPFMRSRNSHCVYIYYLSLRYIDAFRALLMSCDGGRLMGAY